jgi:class 3 adenylate cyclase
VANEPPRLLVVDDNDNNLYTLTRRLQRQGYTELSTAINGREALDLLRRERFDLVLLDIMMPEMNGFEVLEEMKADMSLRDVPVIVISAMDDMESTVKCIRLGAEDHLSKPFEPTLLKARVEASLNRKRLQDQQALMAANLRREKARADAFLHALLPPSAVGELKANQEVKPRRYGDVAVLYCDIVGFTAYCDVTPPEQVVAELQTLVSGFEELTDRHGLEKIKTIGDAYLATAGLQRHTVSPLSAAVRCGLEMAALAASVEPHWQVRVGVHIGPVVAGIVGRRQYLFDVWGDTVNMAARICDKAPAGSVAVSADCWQWLEGEFGGRSLGQHDLKGKGSLELIECQALG